MTEHNKWSRFLPDKLEKWLAGDDRQGSDDAGPPPGEWRPTPDAAPPGLSSPDPLLTFEPPGVEWSPGDGSPAGEICPVCGTEYPEVAPPEARCATCGAERPSAALPAGIADSRTRVLDPDAIIRPRRPCVACGGEVDGDGYCMTCGAKAASERDHFREEPARWVGGVCDRGSRHHRNEDAMALAAGQEPAERGVLVVCDGVSTSEDSDVAALAGAQAARDVLWGNQPKGLGTSESRSAAMAHTLAESCRAANAAVVEGTHLDSENAASATYAAAVVSAGRVFYANLGDSRVYWLPDAGEPLQLTVDDSVAQARIDAGVPREEAENGPGAHAITKWLGRDSSDIEPRVGEWDPAGPGWVLVCSDGLWNYASEATAVRTVLIDALAAAPPPASLVDVAERMVAWANAQGGRDNITVALARLGDLDMLVEPAQAEVTGADALGSGPSEAAPDGSRADVEFVQPDWAHAGPTTALAPPPAEPTTPPRPEAGAAAPPPGVGPASEAPEPGVPASGTSAGPAAIVDTPPPD